MIKSKPSADVNTVRISYDVCLKLMEKTVLYEHQPVFTIKEHSFEKKSKYSTLSQHRHIAISDIQYYKTNDDVKNYVIKELCKKNYYVRYV